MTTDLPITVRKLEFSLPEDGCFDPVWIKNDPTLSYFTLGLSLYNPYIEPFLVQTMRNTLPEITDSILLADIDNFCRQEAQHYQQHERFNKLIRQRDYPGLEDIESCCKSQLQDWTANRSNDFCVGIACGFELYTSKAAVMLLDSRVLDSENADDSLAQLFKWHLVEELEHRNVALTVWEQLSNPYPKRIYYNFIGQRHMLRFSLACMRLMSRVDAQRFGNEYEIDEGTVKKLLAGAYTTCFSTYAPFYSPRRLKITPKVKELVNKFNILTES